MYIKIISDIISHSIRVLINVRKLGKKYNITNRELGILMQAAALHDIGKILIPKKILLKKEKLTLEDKKIISKHSELSYEILKWALPNEVLFLIKNHHNDIEIGKNKLLTILYIADVYDALISKRVYKKAMKKEEAIKIILQGLKNKNINLAQFINKKTA